MSDEKTSGKVGKPSRSLDEEIAVAAAKLQALRDKKKEEERRDRERNQKAILALIKDEGLDAVSADDWKAALPKLRKLLVHQPKPEPQVQANAEQSPVQGNLAPVNT